MDFTLDINREGEIRILQLTDTQTMYSYDGKETDREKNVYRYIRDVVQRTNPDLIVITGDMIYGMFDVEGKGQLELNALMDSFGIPWAPVYGNHDYENDMGQEWLNEQYMKAKHTLYAKGDIVGDCHYTIGIRQNGKYIRELCMLDSGSWTRLKPELQDEQKEWIVTHAGEMGLPTSVFYHIPTEDFAHAAEAAGYDISSRFEIGVDVPAKNGDFGKQASAMGCRFGCELLPYLKAGNVDSVFGGDQHAINTSILWEGIRFTFGLKTGTYDSHDRNALGGTLIRLNGSEISIEHQYCHFD